VLGLLAPTARRPALRQDAPIRANYGKASCNSARNLLVEGKGFVGPALHFLSDLRSAPLQIAAHGCTGRNTGATRAGFYQGSFYRFGPLPTPG